MLVSADWVLPIEGQPLRGGAVTVRNGRVAEVLSAEGATASTLTPRFEFPGCVLLPGLVNAHTHLSLSALQGLLAPADFTSWLARLVPMITSMDADGIAASASLGALQCLSAGITVVGDIAYGPEAPAAAADLGVGGVFFWEVLGIPAEELDSRLSEAEFPAATDHGHAGRVRCGISPHSPYTCGPGLLQAVARRARTERLPVAIHVAESSAETDLMTRGAGPLADVAERLASGFTVPHTSPVAYLSSLGVLRDSLAVHCVHLADGDADILGRETRGVVMCPRSNEFLRTGVPPAESVLRAGATIGVGTDSSASNETLDTFAEARALRRIVTGLRSSRLLEIVTIEGARALGLDALYGSFAQGKQADLVAVRIGPTEDPVTAVIERGSPDAVEAVMTAGLWRVREGRPTFAESAILREAARVTEKARRVAEA